MHQPEETDNTVVGQLYEVMNDPKRVCEAWMSSIAIVKWFYKSLANGPWEVGELTMVAIL